MNISKLLWKHRKEIKVDCDKNGLFTDSLTAVFKDKKINIDYDLIVIRIYFLEWNVFVHIFPFNPLYWYLCKFFVKRYKKIQKVEKAKAEIKNKETRRLYDNLNKQLNKDVNNENK